MEKKDWKKKLRELSFMKGYYFKLEDNGFCSSTRRMGYLVLI